MCQSEICVDCKLLGCGKSYGGNKVRGRCSIKKKNLILINNDQKEVGTETVEGSHLLIFPQPRNCLRPICTQPVVLVVRIQLKSHSLPPLPTVCPFLIMPDKFKRKSKDVRQMHEIKAEHTCFPLPHQILALFPRSEL